MLIADSYIVLTYFGVCMIKTSLDLPSKSSAVFGHVRKFRKMLGKNCVAIGQLLEYLPNSSIKASKTIFSVIRNGEDGNYNGRDLKP